MAERKSDVVYELTSLCLDGNMPKLIGLFMQMNPLEAEDCIAAFWNKASVSNLRKYHKLVTDDGPQMPADILDESNLPDSIAELEIIDIENTYESKDELTLDDEEDEEDEEYRFEL